jgi:hypothetical protein
MYIFNRYLVYLIGMEYLNSVIRELAIPGIIGTYGEHKGHAVA